MAYPAASSGPLIRTVDPRRPRVQGLLLFITAVGVVATAGDGLALDGDYDLLRGLVDPGPYRFAEVRGRGDIETPTGGPGRI